jgi:hypothetical protein
MDSDGLTPVQRAMLEILKDRQPHPLAELAACLADPLGPTRNVHPHLARIRRSFPREQDVACVRYRGKSFYTLVDVAY